MFKKAKLKMSRNDFNTFHQVVAKYIADNISEYSEYRKTMKFSKLLVQKASEFNAEDAEVKAFFLDKEQKVKEEQKVEYQKAINKFWNDEIIDLEIKESHVDGFNIFYDFFTTASIVNLKELGNVAVQSIIFDILDNVEGTTTNTKTKSTNEDIVEVAE